LWAELYLEGWGFLEFFSMDRWYGAKTLEPGVILDSTPNSPNKKYDLEYPVLNLNFLECTKGTHLIRSILKIKGINTYKLLIIIICIYKHTLSVSYC
jgi:hypothetical protein